MYENLPPELKKEIAWVNVWNGSKIPMRAAIRKGASSVLPETWGDFQTAAENVQNGVYDGIGYVFHSTGLIGIDIDAGRDEDGLLPPMAVDIIRHCGSYTEWSRSGRGVHILVRGDLPFNGRNNRQGVEIYKSGRYFIMTGNMLLYPEIITNQEAIDQVEARIPRDHAGVKKPQPDFPCRAASYARIFQSADFQRVAILQLCRL